MKKRKGDPEGAQLYIEANNKIKKEMKKAKETLIEHRCIEMKENLNRNNTRKAYQVLKDLTTKK